MTHLPQHPDIEHLKKQAKDLLRAIDAGDPDALARVRASLPAMANRSDGDIMTKTLRLHDAQSCLAREYGFPSWLSLRNYVEKRNNRLFDSRTTGVPAWLNLVYGHDGERPEPILAARLLQEHPDFGEGDLLLACATGDRQAIERFIHANPASLHRASSTFRCPCCSRPHAMPPLVAVTHSSFLQLVEFRHRLRMSARTLLDAGADPNQSLAGEHGSLSALYGAAGKNDDPELCEMLLAAGANPNDGESLYHSVESTDPTCMKLLLEAGALVNGSNALHHALDYDRIEQFERLLAHTADANDFASPLGPPLLWAIRRRRSVAHVRALLDAGADPHAQTREGTSAYVLALRYGLAEVGAVLRRAGTNAELSPQEQFVAACARHDEHQAQQILFRHPGVIGKLTATQRQLLPEMATVRANDVVQLMVRLGWPIAALTATGSGARVRWSTTGSR